MAHRKATGATTQRANVPGKRFGVKVFGGEKVRAGNIIVTQKGTKFFPGNNTVMGRNFTIQSTIDGIISFRRLTGTRRGKQAIDVIPSTK